MIISSRLVAALHNHAVTVAYARMAGGAINVEPLLAALEDFEGDRVRHRVLLLAVNEARVEVLIFIQLAASDRVLDLRAR